jgi:hypothetical protein
MDVKIDCDETDECAYHEAGHIVFANLVCIPISRATICHPTEKDENQKPTAKTEEKWNCIQKYLLKNFHPERCVIYFLSGGRVESFYCNNNKKHPSDDREISSCGGDIQKLKETAEIYIDDKLSDPKIRAQIEGIAHLLLDKEWHENYDFLKIINQQNPIA